MLTWGTGPAGRLERYPTARAGLDPDTGPALVVATGDDELAGFAARLARLVAQRVPSVTLVELMPDPGTRSAGGAARW